MSEKTLFLVSGDDDASWLGALPSHRSGAGETVIFAPAFKGWLTAERLGFNPVAHEDLAWSLDKLALYDKARRAALTWSELPELSQVLKDIQQFRGYPLLAMHSSMLILSFFEILQSLMFLTAVVERERPNRIVAGARTNPFLRDMLHIVASSGGLEREAARVVAASKGIEFVELPAGDIPPPALQAPPESEGAGADLAWGDGNGPKILIFAWAGYYLKQLSHTFPLLRRDGAKVSLCIVGDELSPEETATFTDMGVRFFKKEDVRLPEAVHLHSEWLAKSHLAFEETAHRPALADFFRHQGMDWFEGLAKEALRREVVSGIPGTVVKLARTEAIIETMEPDMVLSQFSMHPSETCDVLPARKLGIPTLGMCHGVNGNIYAERDTFASEHYAVLGDTYKSALTHCFGSRNGTIIPVGESRLENLRRTKDKRQAKIEAGLDPDAPVLIFCDLSGWTHSLSWRHSTRATISAITALHAEFPDMQIIHRIHHGLEYGHLQRYFESLGDPKLIFQASPSPPFVDIVQAADMVVSHVTSAITEALLLGVPVILLRALAQPEPIYDGYKALPIADRFEELPGMIRAELARAPSHREVRDAAQPFFDAVMHGNDGNATDRLAKLMLLLSRTAPEDRTPGFEDWLGRLRASASFTASFLAGPATLPQSFDLLAEQLSCIHESGSD